MARCLQSAAMLFPLLLAATVATTESSAADTPTAASIPQYSVRFGGSFAGVYYPPYGGDDPYGEGLRLELAMRRGTGHLQFHWLLAASWGPLLTLRGGDEGAPAPGELGLFAVLLSGDLAGGPAYEWGGDDAVSGAAIHAGTALLLGKTF